MKWMFAALALLTASAMAQTDQPAKPYDTPPKPTERFKQCGPDDAAYVARNEITGTVNLLFHITAEGRTDGIVVAASGGDKHLDEGAVQCAREWLYEPAMKDGKPVEVTWGAVLPWTNWIEREPPEPTLHSHGQDDSCVLNPRPDPALLEGKPAVSVVRYRTTPGAVTDARLKTSSDVRELDARAVDCVKRWTFADKLSDGTPANGEWTALIDWREGVPLEESSAEVMANLPCDFADAKGCRATPTPTRRGGEQEQCAGFVEDRRLTIIAHSYAVDAMALAAERGITLDWHEASLAKVDGLLETLRRDGDRDKLYPYAKLFGSYVEHIAPHRGQFGYMTIDGHKVPTMQTWRGCGRYWPWAKVLKRLNGGSDDVAAYYEALEAAEIAYPVSKP
jgi:TonB family protein